MHVYNWVTYLSSESYAKKNYIVVESIDSIGYIKICVKWTRRIGEGDGHDGRSSNTEM